MVKADYCNGEKTMKKNGEDEEMTFFGVAPPLRELRGAGDGFSDCF